MNKLSLVAVAAALALGACSTTPSPDATDTFGAGGFDTGILQDVSPGQSGQLSRAQLEMRKAVADTVNFETDSTDLTQAARAILDGQARWLSENRNYRIVIEGHADERGTRSYNLALGARRADAVKNHLTSRGIEPSRIETMSWGKEAPLETCASERCWSANRRGVTLVK